MSEKPIQIAILGGLSLAAGLLRTPNPNIQITIYEGSSELSEVGAGIGMGSNSVKAGLESRGMRVAEPWADSFMYIRYTGSSEHDGEIITTISREKQSSCHRRHLVAEFARILLPETIKYGLRASKVVNGEDKASIEFTNGTVVETDFVIGRDGIHGKTQRSRPRRRRQRSSTYI